MKELRPSEKWLLSLAESRVGTLWLAGRSGTESVFLWSC